MFNLCFRGHHSCDECLGTLCRSDPGHDLFSCYDRGHCLPLKTVGPEMVEPRASWVGGDALRTRIRCRPGCIRRHHGEHSCVRGGELLCARHAPLRIVRLFEFS